MANQGNQGGNQEGKRKKMTVEEAGRKGGVTTAERYGREFYQAIGRKGGEARAADEDIQSGALGRKGAAARNQQRSGARKGQETKSGGKG